ncbi:MAG TPA: circularly permuted type 2 ATP-grasp protein, partial [Candidatus Hydrogenedentes bacterium]|nr:circularly permuted type 2 ATP-grasp protein [Candidatus Hydrogenedentota bacterium]
GEVREHWTDFTRHIDDVATGDLQQRYDQARAFIEENGVSYNVFGDPKDLNRPWAIDLIPEIIPEAEWAIVEKGIAQRATLMDLLLRDLYGQQRLLADRCIPPAFVYANPAFLRPCHGMHATRSHLLYLYAVDIARGRDGSWVAVADRTQAPSGAGYALENRLVTTRTFPIATRECRVQRLAHYFERLRTMLREIAPSGRDNPSIVLLSPGPSHDLYFEHSYLARYLGFTLVEDDDLTIRDSCVFLKTVEGLSRVDVILRRVDDHLCDPLEFGDESASGLVGLLQAARNGNVAIANPLGTSMTEAPALRALLPDLCRHILGEELLLPSVRTWWCADPDQFRYVQDHFDQLLIAPAFSGRGWSPVVVESLNETERASLRSAVNARPFNFVAQERVTPSTIPVWNGSGLAPRHMMLRTYATADGASYTVMPGGLTRFSESPDSLVISMQRGGGTKDTWVRTTGTVDTHSLLPPPGRRIEIRRTLSNLPSRAADNLYWLGRYLERSESTIRIVRCVLSRVTEDFSGAASKELPAVIRSLALVLPHAPDHNWYKADLDVRELERYCVAALFDKSWNNSVQSAFTTLNRAAWVVRDRISLDTWRILSRLVEELPENGHKPTQLTDSLYLLNQLIMGLAAFSGLATENMTRGLGWRFLDTGRRVERSLNILELLRSMFVFPMDPENAVLQAALEIADSAMTYRSRYGGNLEAPAVLDLLITDESNPRSVAFQFSRLTRHIEALPREKSYPFASREQQFTTRLGAELQLTDIFELSTVTQPGKRVALESRLLDWSCTLRDISEALAWHYFSHTEFSRQVKSLSAESSA